jgi:hypothetical protein
MIRHFLPELRQTVGRMGQVRIRVGVAADSPPMTVETFGRACRVE